MSVITWCVIGLVLGVIAAPLSPPGRPFTKWMPPIMIGIAVAMLAGWFGALTFHVHANQLFEPVSAICAAVATVIVLAAWLFAKYYLRRNPESERRKRRAERRPRTPKRGPM